MGTSQATRRRAWRWLRFSLLTLCGVLLAGLFAGWLLLQTAWARELIRTRTNAALASLFQGKIEIERIGQVGLWGFGGVDARIFDPQGREVIRAQGLSARTSLPSMLLEIIGGSPLTLSISAAQCDHLDVALYNDTDRGVSIGSTFLPREPAKEGTPETDVDFSMPRISVKGLWAHGIVGSAPPIDAELRDLSVSLRYSVRGFELTLAQAQLLARGLPYALDPEGVLRARLEVPEEKEQPLSLRVSLLGSVAEAPALLESSMVGDDIYSWLQLSPIADRSLNDRFQGLAIQGDTSLKAELTGTLPKLQLNIEVLSEAGYAVATGYFIAATDFEAAANITVSALNLSKITAEAPETQLDAVLDAQIVETRPGVFSGSQRLDVQPGMAAAEITPELHLGGQFEISDENTFAHGSVFAQEPGITVEGTYTLRMPASSASTVAVTLDGELRNPPRLQKLGVMAYGKFDAKADWSEDGDKISARAGLALAQLDYRQFKTHDVELQSRLDGTLANPSVQANASFRAAKGRLRGDVHWTRQHQLLTVIATDLDAVQLTRALDLNLPVEGGSLNLDAKVRRTRGRLEGSVQTSARGIQLRRLGSGDMHAQVTLEQRALSGNAQLKFNKLGNIEVIATGIELPDEDFDASQLTALHGEVNAKGDADLTQLAPLLQDSDARLERTRGRVFFDFSARNDATSAEGLRLSAIVETRGLSLTQKIEPTASTDTEDVAAQSTPLALEGIDFRIEVDTVPSNGEAHGTIMARDERGILVEVQAQAELSGVWPPSSSSLAALSQTPLTAKLRVPRRRLETLPALLRPQTLAGTVGLDAQLDGSMANPRMRLQALAQSLRGKTSKKTLDVALEGHYAPEGGDAQITVRHASAQMAAFTTRWRGDLRRAREIGSAQSPIEANAALRLTRFPLDAVPMLDSHQLQGSFSGELTLSDWGKNARIDGKFESRELLLAKVKLRDFTATARNSADELVSAVGFKIGNAPTQASFKTALRWGSQPVPQFEPRAVAKLSTKDFELRALTPLLRANVSELSGILNAETTLTLTPETTQLVGSAKLKDGVVQVPALGQRFSDISARVAVADNRVRLEQLSASGLTGRVTASGDAQLNGLELRSAKGEVSIKRNEKLPVTLEGAAIGEAWGDVRVTYSAQTPSQRLLQINVASFTLLTPETGGQDLQGMTENRDIRIGVRRSDGEFVQLRVQPLEPGGKPKEASEGPPLRIEITLRNVTVERGQVAKVLLSGDLVMLTTPEARVSGRIEIRGGKLDVQGKTFEIERGVVSFDGTDPSNPTITATARWDSPSDHTVTAEYVGDVKTGSIKLRSEPPLTQDEIASLLLFGSPDGAAGSAETDETALAVSVAGGTATKGLNQALSDFTNLNVSTRIDTSTGDARPELVFQGTPRLAAKVSRVVAEPTGGESPDRTFLTLEYRLRRSWALSAVIGDRGASALDLVWRHRY